MRTNMATGLISAVLLIVILIGAFLLLNRPKLVIIEAPLPENFPATGFVHDQFESLLTKYVDREGNIAYADWHNNAADRLALDRYLAAVASFSPDQSPERFATRADKLAYWIYAYNAYVIHSVLAHWPLSSVTDVKAPLEAVKGFGFFYQQRFLFGGEALSLYAVEHKRILQAFKDPRVHFVLNCASESCPVLRPELPTGEDLETLLHEGTIEFVSEKRNVRVDHQRKSIVLSTIFKWYRKDFINDLRRRGRPADRGVIDYIVEHVPDDTRRELLAATAYEVIYEDYDWSINVNDD